MSESKLPPIERMLDAMARRVGPGRVHPLHIRDRLVEAFDAGVRGGRAPNRFALRLHPSDLRALGPDLQRYLSSLAGDLAARARSQGLATVDNIRIETLASRNQLAGSVAVEASFAHAPVPRPAVGVNATKPLQPVQGLSLILPGGERCHVTHLPFTLGRAPECDLVLLSLAVSRRHAQLRYLDGRICIADLGSSNGTRVNGHPVSQAAVGHGSTISLGDITLVVDHPR